MRKNRLFFTLFEEVLFVELLHENAGFLKKLHGKLVGIGIFVYNPRYAAVDDYASADCAGLVRTVKRCSVYGNTEFCRLSNRILLGMYGITSFCTSSALYPESVTHAIAFVATGEYA